MSYRVTVKLEGMDRLREIMDPKQLLADVVELNQRAAVMAVLNLVVLCSVDTGRARGGFLPYLDKHGISAAAKLRQASPLQHGASMNLDARAIQEGRAMGSVVEQPLYVEIRNAVEYVEYINSGTSKMQGTGFIDHTLVGLVDWFPRLWQRYVDKKMEGEKMPGRLDQNPEFGP